MPQDPIPKSMMQTAIEDIKRSEFKLMYLDQHDGTMEDSEYNEFEIVAKDLMILAAKMKERNKPFKN